jgi:hypothetical protein
MTDFIGTLAPQRSANWDICKEEGLWGVVGRGTNWRKNALRVSRGDRIYIWRGGRNNGFIAKVEALDSARLAGGSGVRVPWPDPEWFGAVIPIRVVAELAAPVGDTFPNENGRVGVRFGFNNTTLQHIFEEIPYAVAARVDSIFPDVHDASGFGTPYVTPPPPPAVEKPEPFEVDADLVDRALAAHYFTVERLATWVRAQGRQPLLPLPGEPQYDLAWWDGPLLNVAEVKSLTTGNEESQLRLGLGQVLRYRSALKDRAERARAWLVPERMPTDPSWTRTCSDVGVRLLVP